MTTRSSSRTLLAGALFVLAVPLGAGAQAPQFEGVISMRMSGGGPQAGTMIDAQYHASRNGKARIELATPMGNAAIIMSPVDKKMYLLIESQSAYIEQDLTDLSGAMPENSTPVSINRTGKKETIAGIECEHVLLDDYDVCSASGLGTYLNVGGNLMQGGLLRWQGAVLRENLFPLKVTLPDGTVQMLVTKVERKGLDPALFRVPANYSKMQMPGR